MHKTHILTSSRRRECEGEGECERTLWKNGFHALTLIPLNFPQTESINLTHHWRAERETIENALRRVKNHWSELTRRDEN